MALDIIERRMLERYPVYFEEHDLTQEDILSFLGFGESILGNTKIDRYEDRKPILEICSRLKEKAAAIIRSGDDDQAHAMLDCYWAIILFEARHRQFDSYMLYLERNRDRKDRFYQPKRKVFQKLGIMESIQQLIDGDLEVLGISMPPGTGKTTIEKFLNSAVIGWFPTDYNLFYSHSGDITRMYYDGVYDIVTNSQEYTWREIFPKLEVTGTNAKMQEFNVGKYKPFPSLQCTSVGSKNAGKVRASKFLLIDDMVGSIEEALNKNILDKLWNSYSVDARQRMIPGCQQLFIGTRWSVHDVIGRVENLYEGNPKAKFLAIPDIDTRTGESNFMYEVNPFTVEFFQSQEDAMDSVSYQCLYRNDPIEREGLLYVTETLRRFLEVPEREPDAIWAVCDTKSTGIDYMVMPVCEQYGQDYYLVDCICSDDSDFERQYNDLADILLRNNVQQCEFESNQGGNRIAVEVDKRIKEKEGRCNITQKYTETNKETRIFVNSDWVKDHVLFKDPSMYSMQTHYGRFMSFLTSYSVRGKNPHDDVPDAMANFVLFVTRGRRSTKARVMKSPFAGRII